MAELDDIIEQPSEVEKRIKTLSDKVRLTAEERDEQARLLREAGDKTAAVERERDFYQGFSDVVSTNPAAKDHKDAILEKVKLGYTVEDATYAVLGKAGKLNNPAPTTETQPIAGGSAVTNPPQGGEKSISEMTQAERREVLMDRESDLQNILSPRLVQ